jgi:hypothetical protein
MTDPRLHRTPRNKISEFIAEALDAVTVALLSVVCIVTLAATI